MKLFVAARAFLSNRLEGGKASAILHLEQVRSPVLIVRDESDSAGTALARQVAAARGSLDTHLVPVRALDPQGAVEALTAWLGRKR